jgi:hypothetical protein
MFWTIVAALVFVIWVLPTLLRVLGIGALLAWTKWDDGRAERALLHVQSETARPHIAKRPLTEKQRKDRLWIVIGLLSLAALPFLLVASADSSRDRAHDSATRDTFCRTHSGVPAVKLNGHIWYCSGRDAYCRTTPAANAFINPATGERFEHVPGSDATAKAAQFGIIPEAEYAADVCRGWAW